MLLVQLIISLVGSFGLNFSEKYIEKFAAEEVQRKWELELVKPGAMDTFQQVVSDLSLYIQRSINFEQSVF